MKKILFAAIAAVSMSACGSDSATITVAAPTLTSASAINTYIEGKTWVMTGANIPSHPNGYNENANLGSATQCYNKTSIAVTGGVWNVTSLLGTLTGAATVGSVGTCDNATVLGSPLAFASTNVLVENVQGNATCFDITVTYTGFSQEGRASFSADGKTLKMELFFGGQASGHRCAAGAVGAATVTLNAAAFTGNAVQTYVLQ
jgi:hypothetical protein